MRCTTVSLTAVGACSCDTVREFSAHREPTRLWVAATRSRRTVSTLAPRSRAPPAPAPAAPRGAARGPAAPRAGAGAAPPLPVARQVGAVDGADPRGHGCSGRYWT